MSDPIANAYRELAELLKTLRRIVGRWVERHHGEGSFDRVCSAGVAERLLARRRSEARLGQLPPEAESLLEYTTFSDLAELLLDELELLDRLVPRLAPSPQELLRRLEEMEVIRLQLARAKPVAPAEVEAVGELHAHLVEALRGNGRRPASSSAAAEEEGVDGRGAEPTGGTSPADGGDADPEHAAEERPSAVAGGGDGGEPPPPDETFGVERALAEGDDGAVVRALHDEVTLLADEAIAGAPRHRAAVWLAAREAGWLEANLEALGLDPVARFHEAVEALRHHRSNGANGSEMRRIREELGFTGLLLEMREAFLRIR